MGSARASSHNFENASQRFIDAGIPGKALLPIAPVDAKISESGDLQAKHLGKAPGRYNRFAGDWRGLSGAFVAQGVPDDQQRTFLNWPTPNVGVLGRFLPGIDSDANTEDARRLVEEAINETFGRDSGVAERIRGKGPRRLYAFEAEAPDDPDRWVRTRHIAYKLKHDGEHAPAHKLDVIGYGNQYLIAGTHPSGDEYKWAKDFDLADLYQSEVLERIENNDVTRFLECLRRLVEERGGEWLRASGGRAPGEERDYSDQDPILPPAEIMDGLHKYVHNTEENYPEREDAVSLLSSVRAAFGAEAEEYREEILGWFTKDGFADNDYFDKIWNSLDRGQRVSRNSLDRIFRNNGNYASARQEFPDDHKEEMHEHREKKRAKVTETKQMLDVLASRFIIGEVNTRTGDGEFRMRGTFNVGVEWKCDSWWNYESLDPDTDFLTDLHNVERYAGKAGLYTLLRDLRARHPKVFYTGETKNPNFDRGEIVPEEHQDGSFSFAVNMRYMSQTLRHARRPSKDLRQDKEDVATLREFMGRVFGKDLVDYELDTLAYMLQTGKRPGHLLFLVGDQGVGKSIYMNMLVSLFDGIGKDQNTNIDGTKLVSDSARRFALAKVEGCRIISVKELPDKSTPAQMASILSTVKQLVDAGPDGDFIEIERKRENSNSIRNHARIVISSNYKTAVPIEEQDRRIFYVLCQINLQNKPEESYYSDVVSVTKNPERLAALARWLMDRDISHYRAEVAPPVTRAKAVAAALTIEDPVQRHLIAAVEMLRYSGRWIFDGRELATIMTAMGQNEYNNLGVDDRRDYDLSDTRLASQIGQRLQRVATKLGEFKNNGKRLPTVYALRSKKDLWGHALDRKNDALDLLDDNRERVQTLPLHPWEEYRGKVEL